MNGLGQIGIPQQQAAQQPQQGLGSLAPQRNSSLEMFELANAERMKAREMKLENEAMKPKDDNFEASVLYLEQLELYKQANAVKEEIDRFNSIIISQNRELALLSSKLYELSPIDYVSLFEIFKSMNLTIPEKLFTLVKKIESKRELGLTKTEIKQATLFRYKSDYRVDNVYAFVNKMKEQAQWYKNTYKTNINEEWLKTFGNDI